MGENAPHETRGAVGRCHEAAVAEALDYLEEAAGRGRQTTGAVGEKKRVTAVAAKLVVAAYGHGASREQDPQLHTHCVLMNVGVRGDGTTGAILSRRPGLGGGRDAPVWGVALTSSGSIYASVSAAIYKLSRDSSVWQPVNDIRGRIAGLDGDMLVSQRKSEMIWVKVGSK